MSPSEHDLETLRFNALEDDLVETNQRESLEALRETIFEELFSDTDSLAEAINTLLENEQNRKHLASVFARFFYRCECAHEMNSQVSCADEAKYLHQQLDASLFKQIWATALERAIERADFNR